MISFNMVGMFSHIHWGPFIDLWHAANLPSVSLTAAVRLYHYRHFVELIALLHRGE